MPKARRAGSGKKRPGASAPKKPAGVGIDFKKAKRKVGRKLAPADNAANTTIASKTLTLPSQSVAAERGGAAVAASRGLTLGELLSQLSHPAARVRADALGGVCELATAHPGAAARLAGPTLEALAEAAGDGDGGVRARLGPAMVAVLLAVQGGGGGGGERASTTCSATTPFAPLLLAHARRAMTSVDPGVRRDALSLAGDILDVCGGSGGSAAPGADAVLGAAAGLLAPGLRAASLAAGSLGALARTVAGVRRLLVAVCGGTGAAEGAAGEEAGAPAPPAPPGQPLFGRRCGWLAGGEGEVAPPTPPRDGGPSGTDPLIAGLMRAWEECAPAALALARPVTGRGDGGKRQVDGEGGGGGVRPTKRGRGGVAGGGAPTPTTTTGAAPEAAPTCAADIVACLRLAMRRPGGDGGGGAGTYPTTTTATVAASVLARLPAPAPPAGSAAAKHAPTMSALARLNLEGVRLLGETLPVLLGTEGSSTGDAADTWAAPLLSLAASLLADGRALPPATDAAGGEADASGPAPVPPPGAASAALAAVERTLPVLPPQPAAALLTAVGAFALRSAATSLDRLAAVRAQARLLSGSGGRVPDAIAAAWVRPLPRWLWEVGAGRPGATQAGLRALHAAARVAVPGGELEAALTDVGDELATLLASAVVPQKKRQGGTSSTGRRLLLGPLARLPPPAPTSASSSPASLAVDLVEYLPAVRTPLMTAAALLTLSGAGKGGPADPALGPRLVGAVARRVRTGGSAIVDPIGFGGLLLSLLTGGGAGKGAAGPPGWVTHADAVAVGSAALVSAGDPGAACVALEPGLLGAVEGAPSPAAAAKAALGALATLGAAAAGERAGGAGAPPGLLAALPRLVAVYASGDPESPSFPGPGPALAALSQHASTQAVGDTLSALGAAAGAGGAAATKGSALFATALLADPLLGTLAPQDALAATLKVLTDAADLAQDAADAAAPATAVAVRAFGAAVAMR